MATDDERREVAQNMRDGVKSKAEFEMLSLNGSSAAIRWLISYVVFGDKKYHSGVDLMNRLADLIDPDSHPNSGTEEVQTSQVPKFDPTERGIESIYDWCFERLEGADGAEDYLYCTIMRAIEDYRHPERATAHTVRAVDREALLALADEMDDLAEAWGGKYPTNRVAAYARSIREALGVAS